MALSRILKYREKGCQSTDKQTHFSEYYFFLEPQHAIARRRRDSKSIKNSNSFFFESLETSAEI